MNWHAAAESEVLERLGVDARSGLTAEAVQERLLVGGYNELAAEERLGAGRIFLRQFKDVLIVILLIATVLSALVGEVFDAGLIFLIVVFSAGLGFVQEYRAEKAIEALKKMVAPVSRVVRDGDTKEIPSRELVPGDVLFLEAGDRVPADARLLEVHALKADEASLTGESLPVEKKIGVLPGETVVADRRNMVFAGTVISYGRGRAVVVHTAMTTELGRIAAEVGQVQQEPTPLEKKTAEIGRWLGGVCIGVCVLVVLLSVAREGMRGEIRLDFVLEMIMFGIALAVAAVPEALTAIVTGTLAIGMREMARKNALVRRMPAVETLGSVTVICSDKTGTITKGEMTVTTVHAEGHAVEIGGVGYEPVGSFGDGDTPGRHRELFRAALLCNDARIAREDGRWVVKGDPTEGALVVLAAKAGLEAGEENRNYPRMDELPFSSERKRMTTVHADGAGGRFACMKGAAEVVLEACSGERAGEETRELGPDGRGVLMGVADEMAQRGLRVLAVATKRLSGEEAVTENLERDMVFLGLVGMWDPPRTEVIEAVRACRRVGIRPVMITGDHRLTAVAVARKVDIFREGDTALTDGELDALSDEEFENKVESVSVYARISPLNKLRIVRAWKNKGQVVAMTGDGVNDAPALKHADIGVAMGITGTEVSKEAADMVLADDNFATIVSAVERGRWIYDNIKKYLVYLLESNVVEVAVLGGVVIAMGSDSLPLLPAAILFINLATDGLPALALGVAPPEPDIMERPPRDPAESVFSREVKVFIALIFFIETPIFSWIYFTTPDLAVARTDLFILFVVTELVLALNFRSLRFSVVRALPHKWLTLAVALNVAVTVLLLQSPAIRGAFGINLPGMHSFGLALVMSAVLTLGIEAVKASMRRSRRV